MTKPALNQQIRRQRTHTNYRHHWVFKYEEVEECLRKVAQPTCFETHYADDDSNYDA